MKKIENIKASLIIWITPVKTYKAQVVFNPFQFRDKQQIIMSLLKSEKSKMQFLDSREEEKIKALRAVIISNKRHVKIEDLMREAFINVKNLKT